MTYPDWSLFRAFIAVLRHKTLTGAANALGLSQPTLGRHIAALEAQLGYTLFTRSPEGLKPTAEAEALRPEAEALERAVATMGRAASASARGEGRAIRLSVSEVMAAEGLPPIIADMQAKDASLSFEVSVTNDLEDVARRDADIAIRMARPQNADLLARKARVVELGLFAHPTYLAVRGTPTTTAQLFEHDLIGFDTQRAYTDILRIEGRVVNRQQFRFRSDSDMAQLGAIRAGVGIGVCHVPLAQGLVRILPQAFCPEIDVWVVMHADLARTPRYKTVFRTLARQLKSYGDAPTSVA